jgi:hypothetical protein
MQFVRHYVIAPNAALVARISANQERWAVLLDRTVWSNREGGRSAVTDDDWTANVAELFVVHMRRGAVEESGCSALGLFDDVPLREIFARWGTLDAMEEDDTTDSVASALRKRAGLTIEEQKPLEWFPDR